MSNDNKELKNNAPCEEKQEAHKLTEEELAQVTGGDTARNWGKIGDDWDKYVCDF